MASTPQKDHLIFGGIMFKILSLIALVATVSTASEAPRAPKIPKELAIHGDVRRDNYFWMLTYPEQTHSKEFLSHVEAENRYTEGKTKHLSGLQKKLTKEMIARTVESDL